MTFGLLTTQPHERCCAYADTLDCPGQGWALAGRRVNLREFCARAGTVSAFEAVADAEKSRMRGGVRNIARVDDVRRCRGVRVLPPASAAARPNNAPRERDYGRMARCNLGRLSLARGGEPAALAAVIASDQ